MTNWPSLRDFKWFSTHTSWLSIKENFCGQSVNFVFTIGGFVGLTRYRTRALMLWARKGQCQKRVKNHILRYIPPLINLEFLRLQIFHPMLHQPNTSALVTPFIVFFTSKSDLHSYSKVFSLKLHTLCTRWSVYTWEKWIGDYFNVCMQNIIFDRTPRYCCLQCEDSLWPWEYPLNHMLPTIWIESLIVCTYFFYLRPYSAVSLTVLNFNWAKITPTIKKWYNWWVFVVTGAISFRICTHRILNENIITLLSCCDFFKRLFTLFTLKSSLFTYIQQPDSNRYVILGQPLSRSYLLFHNRLFCLAILHRRSSWRLVVKR